VPRDTEIDKKLKRASRISFLNGWSIIVVAGFSSLIVLVLGEWLGFLIGSLVALGGYLELRGSLLLRSRARHAVQWLVVSQVFLMLILWSYAYYSLSLFDPADPWSRFSPQFKDLMLTINPDKYLVEALLKYSYYAVYLTLILTVLIYQGGLCLYYFSRKKYLYLNSE